MVSEKECEAKQEEGSWLVDARNIERDLLHKKRIQVNLKELSKKQKIDFTKGFFLIPKKLSIKLIYIYQNYSRWIFPSSCRFWPTCSEYAQEAIQRYGFFLGSYIAVRRLLRCHPFSQKSGYDPLI